MTTAAGKTIETHSVLKSLVTNVAKTIVCKQINSSIAVLFGSDDWTLFGYNLFRFTVFSFFLSVNLLFVITPKSKGIPP